MASPISSAAVTPKHDADSRAVVAGADECHGRVSRENDTAAAGDRAEDIDAVGACGVVTMVPGRKASAAICDATSARTVSGTATTMRSDAATSEFRSQISADGSRSWTRAADCGEFATTEFTW
jgi:hypothetical protein